FDNGKRPWYYTRSPLIGTTIEGLKKFSLILYPNGEDEEDYSRICIWNGNKCSVIIHYQISILIGDQCITEGGSIILKMIYITSKKMLLFQYLTDFFFRTNRKNRSKWNNDKQVQS